MWNANQPAFFILLFVVRILNANVLFLKIYGTKLHDNLIVNLYSNVFTPKANYSICPHCVLICMMQKQLLIKFPCFISAHSSAGLSVLWWWVKDQFQDVRLTSIFGNVGFVDGPETVVKGEHLQRRQHREGKHTLFTHAQACTVQHIVSSGLTSLYEVKRQTGLLCCQPPVNQQDRACLQWKDEVYLSTGLWGNAR